MAGSKRRRASLTESRREAILEAVRSGASMETAAGAAGVTTDELVEWLESPSERCKAFARELAEAEAEAEIAAVQHIRAGAKGWQGAAWWLERAHPDRWARGEAKKLRRKRGEGPAKAPKASSSPEKGPAAPPVRLWSPSKAASE